MKKLFLFLLISFLSVSFVNAQKYDHLVYAISDAGSPRGFSKLDFNDVTDYEILYEQSGMNTEWRSSTWMEGKWLAIKYYGDLYQVDLETGIPTKILTLSEGDELLGLTYDPISGILYANDVVNLYSIDPILGSKMLIGPLGTEYGVGGMFGISCDHLGNLYGINTLTDSFYSINPATGEATLIAALNTNVEYYISLVYDQDSHTMYAAGLGDAVNGIYGIYKINLETAEMSMYQEFTEPLEYRVNSLCIPYENNVGINEPMMATSTIFPNPSNNIVNIKSLQEIENIIFLNSIGQEVISIQADNSTEYKIDVSDLKAGVYFIQIKYDNRIESQKIIIE